MKDCSCSLLNAGDADNNGIGCGAESERNSGSTSIYCKQIPMEVHEEQKVGFRLGDGLRKDVVTAVTFHPLDHLLCNEDMA